MTHTPTSSQATGRALLRIAARHTDARALEWLERGLPREGASFAQLDRATFLGRYAGVTRRVGAVRAPWTETEAKELRALGVLEPAVWSLADLTRAGMLLVAAAALPEPEHVAFATEIFRRGETAERVALLRGLSLLPEPARFAPLAAEAFRSHVQDVLEALACENAFPERHLPELAFNQLVMKSLFVGIPLARVHGWQGRVNAELVRMARDFKAERAAAGRPVPDDVAQIEDAAARGQAS